MKQVANKTHLSRPLDVRFWENVSVSDGCWEWTGKRKSGVSNNYGRFFIGMNPTDRNKTVEMFAHRFSWEMHNGAIPDGLYVLHRCDNPPCVRPNHLFLGTLRDNTRDSVNKGRWPIGEHHHHHRLTETDVLSIRREFEAGVSASELARRHNIGRTTAGHIIRRESWRHVA